MSSATANTMEINALEKQESPNMDSQKEASQVPDVQTPEFTDPLLNQPPQVANGPQASPQPKAKRRVTFPSDEKIVSGARDPPSPWNDIGTCSTEDLIQGYLSSCDKFNIKPIPRLLQQLHVITNFCDRNDTLTLRGERLDAKHCETLEEILRRVQFRTIDLEASHLEEEGAIALFDMIEYYESCLRLNISYNKSVGPRGWHSMSRMIKKTPCLEYLEARNCTISEQVMPMVGRSLRLGSSLRILHLENSIGSGRPLMILIAAVKLNDTLRELFLADNKLMPSDGIQLGNLLKFNHKLAVLDVRNNHLQDVGVSHLCDGLAEQNLGMGLTTLVLWNNQVTYQGMQSLSRALYSSQNIETLNLGHNNITNEGIHRLKDGLLHNISLLRIGLQAAKISCEGAVALAEYIAETRRLLRMDLRENEIKTGGLMAISLALKVCTKVNRVDLDQEPKRESGVRDYAEQQRRLLQDIANYTQRNRDLARRQEEEQERQFIAEQLRQEQEAAAKQAEENAKEEGNVEVKSDESEVTNVVTAASAEQPMQPEREPAIEKADNEDKEKSSSEVDEESPLATEEINLEIENDPSKEPTTVQEESTKQGQNEGVQEEPVVKEEETAEIMKEPIVTEDDPQPPQTPPQHQMRLSLNLPLRSRTQELDSPAFVRSEDLVISSPPSEQGPVATLGDKDIFAVTSPPPDFPPSPMILENGQPFLQHVPAVNLLNSLSELDIESPTDIGQISDQDQLASCKSEQKNDSNDASLSEKVGAKGDGDSQIQNEEGSMSHDDNTKDLVQDVESASANVVLSPKENHDADNSLAENKE